MSLRASFEFIISPHFWFSFCFVFVVEDMISRFPALTAVPHHHEEHSALRNHTQINLFSVNLGHGILSE